MPNSPTPNMGIVTPVEGEDDDTWDTIVNQAFAGPIDEHNHTAGRGVQIPSAALKIDADVPWTSDGNRYAISFARALGMAPATALSVSSLTSALFVNSNDSDNLYFRNQAGTNIRVTNGNTLDLTVTGGIGGDYAAVGALVQFVDATNTYEFLQQGSPRPYANAAIGALDLYEGVPGVVNRVRHRSPALLAASYEVVWPGALPSVGSTRLMVMTSSGVIGVQSQAVLGTGVGITLSGTGEIKHGQRSQSHGFGGAFATVGALSPGVFVVGPPAAYRWQLTSGGTVIVPIVGLTAGDRLLIAEVRGSSGADGTVTITQQNFSTAANVSFTPSGQFNTTGSKICSMLSAPPPALLPGETVFVRIAAGASAIDFTHIEITYDRP